jgi:hypothetical protein
MKLNSYSNSGSFSIRFEATGISFVAIVLSLVLGRTGIDKTGNPFVGAESDVSM